MNAETLAPHWERPCAAHGLTSYRAYGRWGWIMIGATDDNDAWRQAFRSTDKPHDLCRWNGSRYELVRVLPPEGMSR